MRQRNPTKSSERHACAAEQTSKAWSRLTCRLGRGRQQRRTRTTSSTRPEGNAKPKQEEWVAPKRNVILRSCMLNTWSSPLTGAPSSMTWTGSGAIVVVLYPRSFVWTLFSCPKSILWAEEAHDEIYGWWYYTHRSQIRQNFLNSIHVSFIVLSIMYGPTEIIMRPFLRGMYFTNVYDILALISFP